MKVWLGGIIIVINTGASNRGYTWADSFFLREKFYELWKKNLKGICKKILFILIILEFSENLELIKKKIRDLCIIFVKFFFT